MKNAIALILLLAVHHVLLAYESPISLPAVSMSRAKMHIDKLASDEMRGRNTPSPELEKAATYIVDQFKEIGLLPINGSYYHTYTLERLHLDKPTTFMVKKGFAISEMNLKDDFIPFESSGSSIVEHAQLAFVGYGITAPEYNYDDYKQLDVKGKVVLMFRGEPQMDNEKSIFDGKRFTKYSRMQSKIKTAIANGAVGVIIVTGPSNSLKIRPTGFPWPSLYPNIPADALPLSRRNSDSPNIPVISAGERFVQMAFGSVDTLKAWQKNIDSLLINQSRIISDFEVLSLQTTLRSEKVEVNNVMGMIKGSEIPEEYVVIGAHYDHVGHSRPNDPAKDSIFNGADDNASGTTGILLSAEAIAQAPTKPKRSIIFVGFSGEEKGLLGSKAFADNPPLPMKNCVAMLNMDMIGRSVNDTLYIGGNTRCKELADLNAEMNRTLFESDTFHLSYTIEQYFFRSDQASFAMKRIPVLFYYTGEHEDYHKVSDEIDKLNMDNLVKIATLCSHTAWSTADLPMRLPFTPLPGDDISD
jgi:hypothetical protein